MTGLHILTSSVICHRLPLLLLRDEMFVLRLQLLHINKCTDRGVVLRQFQQFLHKLCHRRVYLLA